MTSRTVYRHEGSVAPTCDTSSIESTENPRAGGPNINLEALANRRLISQEEIAILNAPERTDLIAQAMRKSELPKDIIDALAQKPAYNVDHSRVIAAALTPPKPLDIPPVDLQSLASFNAQNGAGTAAEAGQDQQDCCNLQ